MNRSKVAKLLITEGAPAGVYDNLGNSALSLLIEKIPEVALDAMDQFHSVDTINRKEFYFLNYLEGTKLQEEQTHARTPLEIAVQNERYDVVMHPVMRRLIGVKWQIYGKWGAILDLVLNLIYTILWTVLAVTLPKHGRDLYIPLKSNVWRLVIVFILILLTLVEIRKQIISKFSCFVKVKDSMYIVTILSINFVIGEKVKRLTLLRKRSCEISFSKVIHQFCIAHFYCAYLIINSS